MIVPRQHERTKVLACLPKATLFALFPDAAADRCCLLRYVCSGIDDDRRQVRVVIRVAVQQQNARLRCNCHTDLVRQLETTSAEFRFADPGSPTLIQDAEQPNALYVLMPMRV